MNKKNKNNKKRGKGNFASGMCSMDGIIHIYRNREDHRNDRETI